MSCGGLDWRLIAPDAASGICRCAMQLDALIFSLAQELDREDGACTPASALRAASRALPAIIAALSDIARMLKCPSNSDRAQNQYRQAATSTRATTATLLVPLAQTAALLVKALAAVEAQDECGCTSVPRAASALQAAVRALHTASEHVTLPAPERASDLIQAINEYTLIAAGTAASGSASLDALCSVERALDTLTAAVLSGSPRPPPVSRGRLGGRGESDVDNSVFELLPDDFISSMGSPRATTAAAGDRSSTSMLPTVSTQSPRPASAFMPRALASSSVTIGVASPPQTARPPSQLLAIPTGSPLPLPSQLPVSLSASRRFEAAGAFRTLSGELPPACTATPGLAAGSSSCEISPDSLDRTPYVFVDGVVNALQGGTQLSGTGHEKSPYHALLQPPCGVVHALDSDAADSENDHDGL